MYICIYTKFVCKIFASIPKKFATSCYHLDLEEPYPCDICSWGFHTGIHGMMTTRKETLDSASSTVVISVKNTMVTVRDETGCSATYLGRQVGQSVDNAGCPSGLIKEIIYCLTPIPTTETPDGALTTTPMIRPTTTIPHSSISLSTYDEDSTEPITTTALITEPIVTSTELECYTPNDECALAGRVAFDSLADHEIYTVLRHWSTSGRNHPVGKRSGALTARGIANKKNLILVKSVNGCYSVYRGEQGATSLLIQGPDCDRDNSPDFIDHITICKAPTRDRALQADSGVPTFQFIDNDKEALDTTQHKTGSSIFTSSSINYVLLSAGLSLVILSVAVFLMKNAKKSVEYERVDQAVHLTS